MKTLTENGLVIWEVVGASEIARRRRKMMLKGLSSDFDALERNWLLRCGSDESELQLEHRSRREETGPSFVRRLNPFRRVVQNASSGKLALERGSQPGVANWSGCAAGKPKRRSDMVFP